MSFSFYVATAGRRVSAAAVQQILDQAELLPKRAASEETWPIGARTVHKTGVSTRPLELGYDGKTFDVRVLTMSSPEDYLLAVRVASTVAALLDSKVQAEHGPDGNPIGPLTPAELTARFDASFADYVLSSTWRAIAMMIPRQGVLELAGPVRAFKIGPAALARFQRAPVPYAAAIAAMRRLNYPEPATIDTPIAEIQRNGSKSTVATVAVTASNAAAPRLIRRADLVRLSVIEAGPKASSADVAFDRFITTLGAGAEPLDEHTWSFTATNEAWKRILEALAPHNVDTGASENIVLNQELLDPTKGQEMLMAIVLRNLAKLPKTSPADQPPDPALLVAPMIWVAADDGTVEAQELAVLEGLLASVRPLRDDNAKELITRAQKLTPSALATVPEAWRKKCFVLAAEVGWCTGKLTSSRVIPRIAGDFKTEVPFAEAVYGVFASKYVKANDPSLPFILASTALLVASADGQIGKNETSALTALLKTLPDFAGLNHATVVGDAAQALAQHGAESVLSKLREMQSFRRKVLVVAVEIALAETGKLEGATENMLRTISEALRSDPLFLDQTLTALSAKHF